MHKTDCNSDHIKNDFTHISIVVLCILLFYVTVIITLHEQKHYTHQNAVWDILRSTKFILVATSPCKK